MKITELIEKLNSMPQDAFVVVKTTSGDYVDVADVCNKMSILKTDELRRYELGIIEGEELNDTPVISIEPGDGLTIIDYNTEQFAFAAIDDLAESLFGAGAKLERCDEEEERELRELEKDMEFMAQIEEIRNIAVPSDM